MSEEFFFNLLTSHKVDEAVARQIVGYLRKENLVFVKAHWRDRMLRLQNIIEEIAKEACDHG